MSDILVKQGDIVWDGDNLTIISKEENLKQQCYLRSTADIGESAFFRNYGGRLFEYVSKPYNYENKTRAETEARRILLEVEGVEAVSELSLELVKIDGKLCKMLFSQIFYMGEVKKLNFNFGV